jgi:predicted  nucleic acid-binding Zn-ribbon protein
MNELGAFKEWLEDHLDDLKAQYPERKHEINDQYQQATLAYEKSLNATLLPNEEVRDLTAQLTTIQEDVTRAIERNEDIAGIIDKITTGVGVATKIASLLIKT